MNRSGIAAVACGVIAFTLAMAGTIDPARDDSKHIEYGAKFPFVAKITCHEVGTGVQRAASCVLISPRCVITSAHVVHGAEKCAVTTDDGKKHEIASVTVHPEFREQGNRHGEADLAVCLLAGDGKFSLDFYPPLYEARDEAGKVVSIAGYGMAGTWATGAERFDGRRRAGSNVVDSVAESLLFCSIDHRRRTELEFLIASGDSGGGLFIGNALAGVNSFIMSGPGTKAKSRHGEESAHVRISTYKTWIEREVARDD